jgi:hypothetical protein
LQNFSLKIVRHDLPFDLKTIRKARVQHRVCESGLVRSR